MTLAARYSTTPGTVQGSHTRRHGLRSATQAVPATRRLSATVFGAGILTLLVGAWGALAPMVGPEFGFVANRTGSFTPTRINVFLSVVPGAVAVVVGALMASASRYSVPARIRPDLWFLGLVAVLCGAWFAIGQYAWAAMGGARYLIPAGPSTMLWKEFGFTVGVGAVLVMLGAMTMGWSGRRAAVVLTEAGVAPVAAAPMAAPVGAAPMAAAPVAPVAPAPPVAAPVAPVPPAPMAAAPVAAPVQTAPVAPVAAQSPYAPAAAPVATTPVVTSDPALAQDRAAGQVPTGYHVPAVPPS